MDAKRESVLVRGAGDFVSGGIRRLCLAGFRVVAAELPHPLCVRRLAAFSEAVFEGRASVEGVTAELANPDDPAGIAAVLDRDEVALIVDPEARILKSHAFDVLVDGRMAKRNLGTTMDDAEFVVGIGPGFSPGSDCHAAVETDAGHDLGRVLYEGSTAPDTGRASPPESYLLPFLAAGSNPPKWNWDLILLRAPADGVFEPAARIGDVVDEGAIVGQVAGVPVRSAIRGIIRGLIRGGSRVSKGLKIGDVDPVVDPRRCRTISEKANAIGGGILEAVSAFSSGRAGRRPRSGSDPSRSH